MASRARRAPFANAIFRLQTPHDDDKVLTEGVIKQVIKTGQLNLSGRGLSTVPPMMFKMYDFKTVDSSAYDWSANTDNDDERWWCRESLTFLDLSSNTLGELPGKIGTFSDLTTLNLQDNTLSELPPEIGQLTKLTRLNLARNEIARLPPEFYKLTELQHLSLAHNRLQLIDEAFGDFVMLASLDLSHNELSDLPLGIGYLVRLGDLNLGHNQLTNLPEDFSSLRGLKILDVTHNNLVGLAYLQTCRKLERVFAQHNDIESLPDVQDCENLRELHLGNNFILEIPKSFCEDMSQLKILELRDNKIQQLPDEIAMLQHLIRLDLTNNDLETLPNTLGLLPCLQNLQLEGNKIKQIRSDIVRGGTTRILKHLREKYETELDNDKFSPPDISLPSSQPTGFKFPDVFSLRHSRSLNLVGNNLTRVPDSAFEEAKKAEVTIVNLCKNRLASVPAGLEIVSGDLTELDLSTNLLTSLPDYFHQCEKLMFLNLSSNMLTDLPPDLTALKYLRELVLSNNRLTKIPECVYDLTNLEILMLNDNQICCIQVTDGLAKLRRLATLNLANNNVGCLPLELGNMKQLRSLELRGNSFRTPRYAILEQGTESVLAYLRDRMPQER